MNWPKRKRAAGAGPKRAEKRGQSAGGFTLIETTIALLLMMIVTLGAASLFAYATYNNTGGADRAQALAIAQQALENLRNTPFDSPLLSQAKTTQTNVRRGGATEVTGRPYTVISDIVDTTPTLKTITISVMPNGAGAAWATNSAGATVTIVTQRARPE
ncbi:MAG TPA: prepilin-type N-terminal cleavage/methylation domain-containing protein [Pyrinomonadaceae bacterium]|jgi:Tfp pilus assembly protein PilV